MKKSELKALIKECLIEILVEGTPSARARQVPSRPVVRETARRPAQVQPQSLPMPATLADVPENLRHLFSDSMQRAFQQSQQDSMQVDKQHQALAEMAPVWESMTFNSTPLPTRAANPLQHLGENQASISDALDNEYDDGFDPHDAVMAAMRRR